MSTLSVVEFSDEEIGKRRILYESAKRQIEQMEAEISEVRFKGDRRLVDAFASLFETLSVLRKYS